MSKTLAQMSGDNFSAITCAVANAIDAFKVQHTEALELYRDCPSEYSGYWFMRANETQAALDELRNIRYNR